MTFQHDSIVKSHWILALKRRGDTVVRGQITPFNEAFYLETLIKLNLALIFN